jgi:hypothetical protein
MGPRFLHGVFCKFYSSIKNLCPQLFFKSRTLNNNDNLLLRLVLKDAIKPNPVQILRQNNIRNYPHSLSSKNPIIVIDLF